MTEPINVWYSDGVRHEDYRQDDGSIITKSGDVLSEGHRCRNNIPMCQEPGCVLAADHRPGQHRPYRVSQLACPHNIPNFGPECPICDHPCPICEGG